jgi:spermidine synthase
MSSLLCLLFALSGAAALLFETLWFRGASLAFGNGVWASAIVLASFMAGLGLGNALAARWGSRVGRPVRAYAALEVTVGLAGFGLVLLLPRLGALLAPGLRPLAEAPYVLNAARLSAAFVLLVVPSAAMGATLPLLAGALHARDPHFGRVLGRLYGWNTLGAVVGSLAGELFLLSRLGVRGSGAVALGANLVAATLALLVSKRLEVGSPSAHVNARLVPLSARARGLLAASCASGFLLLALEVVWFRFLLLFVNGTSLAFALMLAVVLFGIASGGLAAGHLAARAGAPAGATPAIALLAGTLCLASYLLFPLALARVGGGLVWHPLPTAGLAISLMFPVAFCSGMLFPRLGASLQEEVGDAARSTGLLTLANTTGAAFGPLVAGFLLLPGIGMERAIFALGCAYTAVAGLAAFGSPIAPGRRGVTATAAVSLLALVLVFPFGVMESGYLQVPVARYRMREDARVVAVREGLVETIQYVETPRFGEAWYHQLVTNGISMSGNSFAGRRYMKLYVYWPVALHPAPRKALLISFGVGSTAKALTDTRELEQIDVVDISREILELSRIVFPAERDDPLRDPRVRVHVEDGRHFLALTAQRYDLVTAEPPPPNAAGVVNLYSREHFALVRDRLRDGGMATYWLPMHVLSDDEAKAVIRAFCEAFEDCSLWNGFGLDFMLAGTKRARGPVDGARFRRQWDDPTVGAELRRVGIERPEQLGALFVADATTLAGLTAGVEPVTDDFPKRIGDSLEARDPFDSVLVREWSMAAAARERFEKSSLIGRLWPEDVRLATLPYFEIQQLVSDLGTRRRDGSRPALAEVDRLLRTTELRTLPLLLLGGDPFELEIAARAAARGHRDLEIERTLALGALAARRYEEAAARLDLLAGDPGLGLVRGYVLCRAGRPQEALDTATTLARAAPEAFAWLAGTCRDGDLVASRGGERPEARSARSDRPASSPRSP